MCDNVDEQKRLFQFGYDQGQKFIVALKANKITKENLSAEVPMIMLLLLEGPTADFILGRIFETAQDSALEDVYTKGEGVNSDEARSATAKNKFWKLNCQLIGK